MIRKTFAALLLMTFAAGAHAIPIIDQGFESIGGLGDWFQANVSQPIGPSRWDVGNTGVFTAQAGSDGSYLASNFEAAAPGGILDNWLILPQVSLTNGSTFTFWTRSNNSVFPDLLQLRLCLSSCLNPATLETDYATVLAIINPALAVGGYPGDWTAFTVTLSGLTSGAIGRFAFRHYAPSTDFAGDYIGIDSVLYDLKVPEPGTLGLLALALALVIVLRLRARPR